MNLSRHCVKNMYKETEGAPIVHLYHRFWSTYSQRISNVEAARLKSGNILLSKSSRSDTIVEFPMASKIMISCSDVALVELVYFIQ